MIIKNCKLCGEPFEAKGNGCLYCSKCGKDAERESNKNRKLRMKNRERQLIESEKRGLSLSEISRRAKEEGLSYCQYVSKYGL